MSRAIIGEKEEGALDAAGARTSLVSPRPDTIKAWQHDHWGGEIRVDVPLERASADDQGLAAGNTH